MLIHFYTLIFLQGAWVCECDPCYSGAMCEKYCNDVEGANCTNGTCDCGFEGWRGDRCTIKGCPGVGTDCSGHGYCNGDGTCVCISGWRGRGCETPVCTANCTGRGDCIVVNNQPTCECATSFFGVGCEYECAFGQVYDTQNCTCDPCYGGYECNVECTGRGNCTNGTCDCGFTGWKGDLCELPGCPSVNDKDCSGHGTCNLAERLCQCQSSDESGWEGEGCEQPNCPGIPDCFGRGVCDIAAGTFPECKSCDTGWMGIDCNTPCNGTQNPMDSGKCECNDNCTYGKSCDIVCSKIGMCLNDSCACYNTTDGYNEGYYGRYCEDKGCPGTNNDECSGPDHGICLKNPYRCSCKDGWYGEVCDQPDCPGEPDCENQGVCNAEGKSPICECNEGFMGKKCDLRCDHGNVTLDENQDTEDENKDEVCTCNPCYSGGACDIECNGHGNCTEGQCSCEEAWRGDNCEIKGCPGETKDCSGHGECILSDQTCSCHDGWKNKSCNVADCPGIPDCNGRGDCAVVDADGNPVDKPICVNCTLSMGEECELPCIHGVEDPPLGKKCVCDPCYDGSDCDTECTNQGQCVNGTCQCDPGFSGELCDTRDCPGEPDCLGKDRGICRRNEHNNDSICQCNAGFKDEDCSGLICPGKPEMCNAKGNCTVPVGAKSPSCICDHGFDGEACDVCMPRFVGSGCDECKEGYIGYNTDCSVLCLHGYATEPGGDICKCYRDMTEGFWTGGSCDECVFGFALPDCVHCAEDWVGPGLCTIPCETGQGEYRDVLDVDDDKREDGEMLPVFHCVYSPNDDGNYTAYFGYDNQNSHNVKLAVGADNMFTSNRSANPESWKAPSKFRPGFFDYVFSIK